MSLRDRIKEILKVSRDMKDDDYYGNIDVIAATILEEARRELPEKYHIMSNLIIETADNLLSNRELSRRAFNQAVVLIEDKLRGGD